MKKYGGSSVSSRGGNFSIEQIRPLLEEKVGIHEMNGEISALKSQMNDIYTEMRGMIGRSQEN